MKITLIEPNVEDYGMSDYRTTVFAGFEYENKKYLVRNIHTDYISTEGKIKVEIRLIDEDVWLNVEAISNLFNVDRSGIVRHISNIYKDEELDESSICAKIAQVQKEGNRIEKRKAGRYENIVYSF